MRASPVSRRYPARRVLWMLVGALSILPLIRCSNPEQSGSIVNPIPLPGPDDPTLDTVYSRIESRIRLEAVIDRSRFPFTRIPDSMRIAIVAYIRSDSIPYREIYSASSVYLNLGTAVTIPFETTIPPAFFWKYNNARLCIGYVIVFADANKNKTFDFGETVYGVGEQAAFGYAYGNKLGNIPREAFQDIIGGPNAMFRIGGDPYAVFKTAPDFDASIFKINIRGASYSYIVPYPWKPTMRLTP